MIRAAVIAAITIAPAIAAAQPSAASPAANAQFDKGRALMKERKYAEACAAFEQSQKLEPQWGTLYNLAVCSERIGKLASAWSAYRELAARDTNAERRKDARKQIAALDKRLPRLRLMMATRPPGLVVTTYGIDVTGLIGVDSPVDLGSHSIQVRAPGFRPLETVAKITEEAKTVTVELVLVPEGDVPAAAPNETPILSPIVAPIAPPIGPTPPGAVADDSATSISTTSGTDPRWKRRRLAMFVGIGGGVVATTGLLFGWSASRNWSSAKDICGNDLRCDTDEQRADGNKKADRARLHANLATGFVVGGVAVVGAAAVLWFTAPRERPPAHTLSIAPSADGASLVLGGSF